MKRLLALFALLAFFSACSSSPTASTRSVQTTDTSSFGIAIVAATPNGAGSSTLAHCLSGANDGVCFSASRIRAHEMRHGEAVGTPLSLSGSASGSTVTLTWNAPFLSAVTAYVIEAGSAPGLADLASFSTGNTQTSLSATGVGAGSYYVRVRAVGSTGDVGQSSNEVLLVVGTSGPCSAPSAPSGLVLGSIVSSTVTLTWSPAAGNPTSYVVEAGSGSGLSNLANSDLGSPTPGLTATNVGNGTYYLRVRAKNACGVSAPSNEVSFTVGFAPTPLPTPTPAPCASGPPSGLSASVLGSAVVYKWSAPSGTAPTSYVLEAGTAPGLANVATQDLGSAATTFSATSVAVGTYYVRFRSKNACGVSSPSNEIVVTITAPSPTPTPTPTPTPPPTPTPTPGGSFGPGQYRVGSGISAGRYYSVPSYGCYFERESGFGGTLAEIISNAFIGFNPGQWIVDIASSDVGFQTKTACGTWYNAPRRGFQSTIAPGMWLVGSQVAAGTYSATVQYGCYWERLSDFSNSLYGIISNNFVSTAGSQFVTIGAGDTGFDTNASCGSWTRVSGITADAVTATQTPEQIEQNRAMDRSRNWR